jgi:hypothetical protein
MFSEKRHDNLLGRAACCRSNVGGNAGNGTLLCRESGKSRGDALSPVVNSRSHFRRRYSVRPSKRASLASVTACERLCAPSMRNTPALLARPLIGIRSHNRPEKGCREKARIALDSPESAVKVATAQPVSIFASASRATVLTERRNAHLRSETVAG